MQTHTHGASAPGSKSPFQPLLDELLNEARGINSAGLNRLLGQVLILKQQFPVVQKEGFGKVIPFPRMRKESGHV